VKVRERGTANAGQTTTIDVNEVGVVTGNKAPSYLTFSWTQLPDNANRLIVSGTPSIFRDGRIALPGVPAASFDGTNVVGSYVTDTTQVGEAFLNVPSSNPSSGNPDMTLCMTRVVGGTLLAKCNLTGIIFNGIGTQLTRKGDI
jgi:hypothetical protein